MGNIGWVRSQVSRRLPPQLKRHIVTPQRKRYLAYTDAHGRLPWVPGMKPRTFWGKTQWRIMYDRREGLKVLSDKLAIKDIAAEHGVATPRTLWSGTDPAGLAAASQRFRGRWVLKPNHGSQVVRFFEGPITEDVAQEVTAGWVAHDHSRIYGEWHTQFARRLILAEESLVREGDDLPPDYKFFVFDGRPVAVAVFADRSTKLTMTFYRLPGWDPIEVVQRGMPRAKFVGPPSELPEMLDVAARLGAGWDFLRVDLYAVDGRVWLGELTATPAGAQGSFDPRSFDRWLGSHWTLPLEARADGSVVV